MKDTHHHSLVRYLNDIVAMERDIVNVIRTQGQFKVCAVKLSPVRDTDEAAAVASTTHPSTH